MNDSSGATALLPLRVTASDGFLLGLESLMRRTGQGRHLAATVVECAGAPDLAAIQAAATRLGRRHPLLHARIARSRRDWIARWHPSPAGPQPLPLSLWRLPGIATTTAAAWEEIPSVEALLDARLNGDSIDIRIPGPNLHFHVVLTGAATWSFILIWSHSLHDAVGIAKLLQEIAAPADSPAPEIAENAAPVSASFGELYRRAHPMIEEMRSFPAWRVRSLHRKGVTPGASRFELVRWNRGETAAIRAQMAATAGELLLLPYFACCAARAVHAVIAARHPQETPPVLLSLPVQRQGDPARRPLFQNHMAVYTLLLTAEELAELKPATRTLYRKYADFIRRKLPAAMDALMQLMERCPSRLYNLPAFLYLRGEICTLFHSHTGAFAPDLTGLFGSRILNGYHIPTVSSPPGIGLFFSEFDGQLTLTLSWKEGCLEPRERELLKRTLALDLGAPPPQQS